MSLILLLPPIISEKMDIDVSAIIVALTAFSGFAIGLPVAYQFVNNISGMIQASRLQEQINENNAINNTTTTEEQQIAK